MSRKRPEKRSERVARNQRASESLTPSLQPWAPPGTDIHLDPSGHYEPVQSAEHRKLTSIYRRRSE